MRPLELTLDGFRSYRERTVFDFRRRRLVGIVGPVGAGKSSVLDGVAFALYGKTPVFERDTKSLIHQLADACHVELVFEVEGQIWRAQRALRRKGASGHKLERLAVDEPGAEVLESIQQERHVRERVSQLLGLEFDAFCRSVLLAQGRFAEFLKATPTERNEVLKGVFGYERFDGAQAVARERAKMADAELEGLGRERERLAAVERELEDAREALKQASEIHRRVAAAKASVDPLTAARAEAERAAAEAGARAELISAVLADLEALDPDDAIAAAEAAQSSVDRARADAAAAASARQGADALLEAVTERVGDRARFQAFAALVARHDHEAAAAAEATARREHAEQEAGNGASAAEKAAEATEIARKRLAAAEVDLTAALTLVAEAEVALHEARHGEMAATLRRELAPGEPCPVCAQPVVSLPKRVAAPKVDAAESRAARAHTQEERARVARDSAATGAATADADVQAASAVLARLTNAVTEADGILGRTSAALTATKSELVDRLGEGDPQGLLAARERELETAEQAAKAAATRETAAAAASDGAMQAGADAAARIARLAAKLAQLWGRLGEPRDVELEPARVREGARQLAATIAERGDEVVAALETAHQDAAAAAADLAKALEDAGLPAEADISQALAEALAAKAAAEQAVQGFAGQLDAGRDLRQRLSDATNRRDLAGRLASDLQPSRFLAFLLEEERAALADLGSTHFEQLTDGSYRFTEDDSFRVLDLNAGGTERPSDSLSGGETFLASLALALALAEMVARGGGRLDAFFLDEGFGSLDADHLERAMDGIGRLLVGDAHRLVVLVSHVEQMRQLLEDLIVLDKDSLTGDTVVRSGAAAGR